MSESLFRISEQDTKQVVESIKDITTAMQAVIEDSQTEVSICTMEIAEMFGWSHTKVFNMVSEYVNVNAEEQEKKEFRFAERIYKQVVRKQAVCYLTEKGSQIFIDKICAEENSKSQRFIEGVEKLKRELVREKNEQSSILMDGRSRMERQKIKGLFDRFITGPALENREIAELTEKYQIFHNVMGEVQMQVKETNKIEGAVYDVAIEAELQGFIYGFKLYEELLNRQLLTI